MPRQLLAFFLTSIALTACGGGERSVSTQPVTEASTVQPSQSSPSMATAGTPTNLGTHIQALEASGQLPKLDRSTDIKGPDTDNNGIRDDIDAWIAAQPITDPQKKAAQQMARVQQAALVADLSDKSTLQILGDRSMAAVKCLRQSFMPDYQKGYDLVDQIEAITANTKERAKQYIAYNRAVSGSSGRLPEGNTCEP